MWIPFNWLCVDGGSAVDDIRAALANPILDPDTAEGEALVSAAYSGRPEVVSLLLSDPRVHAEKQNTRKERNALDTACSGGKLDVLQVLLADGRIDPSLGNARPLRSIRNQWGSEALVAALRADPRVAAVTAGWPGEWPGNATDEDDDNDNDRYYRDDIDRD